MFFTTSTKKTTFLTSYLLSRKMKRNGSALEGKNLLLEEQSLSFFKELTLTEGEAKMEKANRVVSSESISTLYFSHHFFIYFYMYLYLFLACLYICTGRAVAVHLAWASLLGLSAVAKCLVFVAPA